MGWNPKHSKVFTCMIYPSLTYPSILLPQNLLLTPHVLSAHHPNCKTRSKSLSRFCLDSTRKMTSRPHRRLCACVWVYWQMLVPVTSKCFMSLKSCRNTKASGKWAIVWQERWWNWTQMIEQHTGRTHSTRILKGTHMERKKKSSKHTLYFDRAKDKAFQCVCMYSFTEEETGWEDLRVLTNHLAWY